MPYSVLQKHRAYSIVTLLCPSTNLLLHIFFVALALIFFRLLSLARLHVRVVDEAAASYE